MTAICYLKSKPVFRAILYLPIILGITILAVIAMRWSLADVYATQLTHHLDTVNQDSSNKNDDQWRLAGQHLEKTLELRPTYARYLELASLFNQKLDILEVDRKNLAQELGWQPNEPKFLGYLRRSIRLTPSWPYLWSRLVVSKLVLQQFDEELNGAMERAVNLGRWERSVQYDLALLGLNSWPNLRGKARLEGLQAIEQTWVMEKIQHSDAFDIAPILTHANLSQACDQDAKIMSNLKLQTFCARHK
ncbi:hypothetical protein [Candidatus Methylomicrobium oryzae]|uniref:hypothetical protein n=1 Tax=Candidatus Methylomicrobium oryzae TaxID=2802053 RepID=UPI001925104C|nr:hypothetical protein [Methylomicrobium sp. RS1]MBL1262361.1 hypothetical protein [Methylomicrobium sp. RS1]